MWFASYLHTQGVITGEQFAVAVRQQLSDRPMVGHVAIDDGKLTAKQIIRILMAQANTDGKSFGQVAIQLGFLNETDVARLLARQTDSVPPLSTYLVRNGAITDQEAVNHLALAAGKANSAELSASKADSVTQSA